MLPQEWNIQSRAPQCAVSGNAFQKGDRVYSALYWRDGQYARVDLGAEAWLARNDNIEPVSAWQTEFVPPAPPLPEALGKKDAEALLRELISLHDPSTLNARYILALMLERKKVLRQVNRQHQDGTSVLVYEHMPTGDVWLIDDPGLKLGELKSVQDEVADLLARSERTETPGENATRSAAPLEPAPTTEPPALGEEANNPG